MTAVGMSPTPTAEETAAIVAAIEFNWPRPVVVLADPQPTTPPWRFSGRWWVRPVAQRRDRP